jgi:hypothetical protein
LCPSRTGCTINNQYSTLPFWYDEVDFSDTSRGVQPLPPLPDKAEVLVIGGGFTGLSAALTLARAGKQVLLVDARQIGSDASSRNGGLLGFWFMPALLRWHSFADKMGW